MKTKVYLPYVQNSKLLTLFTILFLWISVSAQENDKTESPYFSVIVEDSTEVEFALKATNVNATISGVIANVEMEQVYENSGKTELDATYIFPMSTRAAVYSMQMIVDDRVIDAEIKEKSEALEIFEEANENGQTATLLDQQRPNVFQMSLANVEAGSTLKVRMNYTELIEPEKSIYQFVVPSIVGPRFTTGGEEWVEQSIKDSLDVSNTELNIDLKINAGMDVTATCTSHEVEFTNEEETVYGSLATNPGKDYIVDYTLDGDQIETGLLLYEEEEENFFLAMVQPPRPTIDFRSPKREYVFIMDVSGSMRGFPIDVSKELISNLLADLNSDDKFNVLFFAGGSSLLSENSLPVTPENINSALTMIDAMQGGGGTQLLPAMERALSMEGTEGFSRTFVILTDGYVTVEKEAYELMRQRLNEANFFAFGIGTSVNRYIIEGIAYVGQGAHFVATDLDEAKSTADTFKEYIERPALTNIEATFDGINVYDVEPVSIPDLFAERPVIIFGKYDDADGNVTIAGDFASGTVSSTLSFADYHNNVEENVAIKYLWARKRIKLMSDYGIASDESANAPSIEEQITQLGLDCSLVTQYTSFVAVDSLAVTDVQEDPQYYGYYESGFPQSGHPLPPPPPLSDVDSSTIVDIENYNLGSDAKQNDIIEIVGANTVTGKQLNISLKNIEALNFDKLILSIVDINGATLVNKELSTEDLENIISLNISTLSSRGYFITLSSNIKILNTEKFIVVK